MTFEASAHSCKNFHKSTFTGYLHWTIGVYHPHPKDGEGNAFTGVCPFRGGGTPVQIMGGTFWPGQDWGTPCSQDRVPPWPGQDWGTIPPPPPRQNSRVSTCYAAAVCHAGGLSCFGKFVSFNTNGAFAKISVCECSQSSGKGG